MIDGISNINKSQNQIERDNEISVVEYDYFPLSSILFDFFFKRLSYKVNDTIF
jgi:hypothetical protein